MCTERRGDVAVGCFGVGFGQNPGQEFDGSGGGISRNFTGISREFGGELLASRPASGRAADPRFSRKTPGNPGIRISRFRRRFVGGAYNFAAGRLSTALSAVLEEVSARNGVRFSGHLGPRSRWQSAHVPADFRLAPEGSPRVAPEVRPWGRLPSR